MQPLVAMTVPLPHHLGNCHATSVVTVLMMILMCS